MPTSPSIAPAPSPSPTPGTVSLTGTVASSSGARLSGATVTVLDGANSGRTAVTSSNGEFRFDNMQAGNANFSARAIGFFEGTRGIFVDGVAMLNFTLAPVSFAGMWSVLFGTPNNGLDVSACNVSIPGGLSGQVVNVDSSGAFHEVWAPSTPNLLQADGTLTATAVSATLKCVATSSTGSLSATANGSEYTGTATLSGRTVAVRVLRFAP